MNNELPIAILKKEMEQMVGSLIVQEQDLQTILTTIELLKADINEIQEAIKKLSSF